MARPGAAGERKKAACVARAPQKSNPVGWLVTLSGPTDLLASFSKNHRSPRRGSSPPLTSEPESISRGDAGTVAFEAVTPGSDVLQMQFPARSHWPPGTFGARPSSGPPFAHGSV